MSYQSRCCGLAEAVGRFITMRSNGLPPGPPQSQLRQVLEWTWRPVRLLEECQRRYGDAFTLRMGGLPPIVILSDPAAVREVFTGDPEKLRSGQANRFLEAALGRYSLLVLDGREHLRERKLMLPPFHGERMRAYAGVIDSIAEREVASWPTNEPFRVAPAMRSIALEVILRAVFGVDDVGTERPAAPRARADAGGHDAPLALPRPAPCTAPSSLRARMAASEPADATRRQAVVR